MILKAVETADMLIKLINHWSLFQLQPSLISRGGSAGFREMRGSEELALSGTAPWDWTAESRGEPASWFPHLGLLISQGYSTQ